MHPAITRALSVIATTQPLSAAHVRTMTAAHRDLQSLGETLQRLESRQREFVTEWYGERCPDVCETCPCCQAWADFDVLYPPDPRPENFLKIVSESPE